MCDFTPDIPKSTATAAPPPAPLKAPKLLDPLAATADGTNADGTPIRKNLSGLASLRIDRQTGGTGLNVPR